MTLTKDEFNALDKIAAATKMDCWFSIHQDAYGQDHVLDIENDEILSLEDGLSQFAEGIVYPLDTDIYGLTLAELDAVRNLFNHFGIDVV